MLTQSSGSKEKQQSTFQDFAAGTFYKEMLKSLRKMHSKPAYFYGGHAEDIFQGQMDQQVAEDMAHNKAEARFPIPLPGIPEPPRPPLNTGTVVRFANLLCQPRVTLGAGGLGEPCLGEAPPWERHAAAAPVRRSVARAIDKRGHRPSLCVFASPSFMPTAEGRGCRLYVAIRSLKLSAVHCMMHETQAFWAFVSSPVK